MLFTLKDITVIFLGILAYFLNCFYACFSPGDFAGGLPAAGDRAPCTVFFRSAINQILVKQRLLLLYFQRINYYVF